MSSATLKKLALSLCLFAVLCFVLSRATEYYQKKNVPPFLAEMQESLPENPNIVAKVGEDALFEHTFNIGDLSKDTLDFTFWLRSEKGTMKISGYATKQKGNWVPTKTDTLFTQ